MYLERHERRSSHLKELHRASPDDRVQRRDPGLVIGLDLPILPTIKVTLLAKPTPTTPPPAATSASANTPPPPANSPTPTPTQAPVASPSPSSPPSNGGGGTGPSNPSNGEGNTGGSNGGNSGNGQPAPSVSQGDSGGQDPTPSSTPGGGGGSTGGTGNGSGGDISNGSDGSDTGSGGSSSNGGVNGGSGNNLGSPFPNSSNVDSGQGTSNSATDGSGAPVVNAGGIPGVGSGGGLSGTSTLNSDMTTIRLSPSGTENGSSPTHTNTGGEDGGADRGGLPQAAGIAIAVICSILFIIGLIILLRHHRKTRRDERIHHWWFTKKRTSRVYNDDQVHVVQMPDAQSARSSFATTFDRSAQFQVNFNSDVPSLPPMAEVRRSRNELDYPMATPSNESGDHRFSIGSSNSGNSSYFFINHRPSIDTSNSHRPTNANPFDPSPELFAFPKPPSDLSSDRKSGYSSSSVATTTRPLSRATNTDSRNYHTPDTSPSPPEHQDLPAINADPFADGIAGMAHSTSSHTTDPFSDSTVSTSHETSGEGVVFAEVLRPFTRSMPDELTVRPGDQVKVVQIFDDGWAVVDMPVPPSSSSEARYERGLVPLGCLR
ncbi:hypothetical protein EST38_g4509 [Candolleomyces aberdarensis]|uniref:SH3 domain-containing protein n=1 Tax=Candolleomyces aberdarensis TaxID=2316362 RepID=A0A4Q2DMV2_9AGAR|nr:hypothetical protein EST38_g4509 [Candolleomyces aberdarensis]